jgi:hypothetical protein
MRFYASSLGEHRGFCSVYGFDAKPRELGLAIGILDDDPGGRPICHVFTGSKAPWFEITDALPQYEAFPTGSVPPSVPAPRAKE